MRYFLNKICFTCGLSFPSLLKIVITRLSAGNFTPNADWTQGLLLEVERTSKAKKFKAMKVRKAKIKKLNAKTLVTKKSNKILTNLFIEKNQFIEILAGKWTFKLRLL